MSTLADFITFRSPHEREAVEKLLHKGLRRQVLWATRPEPRLRCCVNVLPWLTFGVYGLLFTACWTAAALQSGQPQQALFSLPFWVVGLGFLLHPLYVRRRLRRSVYVLAGPVCVQTLEPGLFGWRRYAWPLKNNLLLAVREEADGSGDLIFSRECYDSRSSSRDGWRGLADVRLAEEKLAAALGQTLPPRGALRGAAVRDLTPAQRALLETLLLRGEHLEWVEHPRSCIEWRGNIRLMVWGLWGCAFALGLLCLLAESCIPMDGTSDYGTVVIAGFALLVLACAAPCALKPFWRRWQLARTLYVLTDRRALIVEPCWRGWRSHAYLLKPRMVLSRVREKDGSGDLVLEEERAAKPHQVLRRGFLALPDLRAAEAQLDKAVRNIRA